MRGMTGYFSAIPDPTPAEVATVSALVAVRAGSDAGAVLAMLGIEVAA